MDQLVIWYFFTTQKNPGLIIDIAQDIRMLNDTAIDAKKSGMLILGGGVVKHHICNANLFRNGADYCVFINTGQEFDGSDSGAKPEEALSWGKIKLSAKPVKLYADASLVFPLIVAQTFAKEVESRSKPLSSDPSHHQAREQQQQQIPTNDQKAKKQERRSFNQLFSLAILGVGLVLLLTQGRRR